MLLKGKWDVACFSFFLQAILADKLGLVIPSRGVEDVADANLDPSTGRCLCPHAPAVTPLRLLRLMFAASKAASLRLGLPDLLPQRLPDDLVHKLEILACDSLTLAHRPSEVALALLAADFQRRAAAAAAPHETAALMGLVAELQRRCAMPAQSFVACLGRVVALLEKYNGEGTVAHRQRLIWKLSNRTLRHLRPTDKLRATLPTIKEQQQAAVAGADAGPHRMRYAICTFKCINIPHNDCLFQIPRSNSECSEESMESFSSECGDESDASSNGEDPMDTEE